MFLLFPRLSNSFKLTSETPGGGTLEPHREAARTLGSTYKKLKLSRTEYHQSPSGNVSPGITDRDNLAQDGRGQMQVNKAFPGRKNLSQSTSSWGWPEVTSKKEGANGQTPPQKMHPSHQGWDENTDA